MSADVTRFLWALSSSTPVRPQVADSRRIDASRSLRSSSTFLVPPFEHVPFQQLAGGQPFSVLVHSEAIRFGSIQSVRENGRSHNSPGTSGPFSIMPKRSQEWPGHGVSLYRLDLPVGRSRQNNRDSENPK